MSSWISSSVDITIKLLYEGNRIYNINNFQNLVF